MNENRTVRAIAQQLIDAGKGEEAVAIHMKYLDRNLPHKARAAFNIAAIYEGAQGTAKDLVKAIYYYEVAEAAGG